MNILFNIGIIIDKIILNMDYNLHIITWCIWYIYNLRYYSIL